MATKSTSLIKLIGYLNKLDIQEEYSFNIENKTVKNSSLFYIQDEIAFKSCIKQFYKEHYALPNFTHTFNKTKYNLLTLKRSEYLKEKFIKRIYNETSLNYFKLSYSSRTENLRLNQINKQDVCFTTNHYFSRAEFASQIFELNLKEGDLDKPYQIFLDIKKQFDLDPDYKYHEALKIQELSNLVFDREAYERNK